MFLRRLGAMVFAVALTSSILGGISPAKAVDEFNNATYSIDSPDSIWVVVNKKRPLNPKTYIPADLVRPGSFNTGRYQLARVASISYIHMARAMKAAGAGTLELHSGYRSYTTQKSVHAGAVAKWGRVAGENLAARPGFSEHQTALAADVGVPAQGCRIRVCFGTTKGGKWLAKNAWKYGFIIRYPNGQTNITGYQYEPWHIRYVGVDLATEMHNRGVSVLESFWELPSAKTY